MSDWTFLTNHSHVLLLLSRDADLRMRDLADTVGITERAVHRIVSELTESGYLVVEKRGRRNHYSVRPDRKLRHPVEAGVSVAKLLALLSHPS